MAHIVSTNVITCPECGVQAIVRVWSCGCQGVSAPAHKSNCSYRNSDLFERYKRECPYFDKYSREMSDPRNHPDN